jgi:hypothetical protein
VRRVPAHGLRVRAQQIVRENPHVLAQTQAATVLHGMGCRTSTTVGRTVGQIIDVTAMHSPELVTGKLIT